MARAKRRRAEVLGRPWLGGSCSGFGLAAEATGEHVADALLVRVFVDPAVVVLEDERAMNVWEEDEEARPVPQQRRLRVA